MTAHRHTFWFWLAAFAGLLVLLALFRDILLPFVMGLVLAYFLNPVADWLQRHGIGRTAGAALIITVGAVVLGVVFFTLVPVLVEQIRDVAVSLPGTIERLRTELEAFLVRRFGDQIPSVRQALDSTVGDLKSVAGQAVGQLALTLWSGGMALVNFLSLILVTPLVVFYLLADWDRLVSKVRSWLPRDHKATIERLARDIDTAVGAFIRGQGTLCLMLAVVYSIGLMAIGLKNGVAIGLLTGLLSFVPVVGALTGFLTALAVAIAQSGMDGWMLAKVAGVFALGQAVEGAVGPYLVGQKLGLHPVWMIFALFAFSSVFGFVGTLVAVPVSAAVAVLIRFGLEQYLASDVYRGTEAAPKKNDSGPGAVMVAEGSSVTEQSA